MHIFFALHGFPPRQNGGTEWETSRRARHLMAAGHRVTVAAIDRVDPQLDSPVHLESESIDGLPVHRLSLRGGQGWDSAAEHDDPRVYESLQALLRADRPDLVHVLSGYRMTAAAVHAAADLDIPVMLTAMDFWLICPRIILRRGSGELCRPPEDPMTCVTCLATDWRRYRLPHHLSLGLSSQLLGRLWRRPELRPPEIDSIHSAMMQRGTSLQRAVSRVDTVVVASRFLADLLGERMAFERPIVLMRQGLDTSRWLPAERASRDAIHIGFIGQIAEHKGLFDLVQAFNHIATEHPELRLLVFGDHEGAWPPDRERLLRLVRQQPRIQLMGPFSNETIRQVHTQLDLLVVPSKWYENSPNVILEAFACGTPVIASRMGGMAELVVEGRGGWTFAAGDVTDLARVLTHAVQAPERLAAARKGMPPVRSIDEEMVELVDRYASILQRQAARSHSSGEHRATGGHPDPG